MSLSYSEFEPRPDQRIVDSGLAAGLKHVAANERWTFTYDDRRKETRFRFASYHTTLGKAVLALASPAPRASRSRSYPRQLNAGQQAFSLLEATGLKPAAVAGILNTSRSNSSTNRKRIMEALNLDTYAFGEVAVCAVTQRCIERRIFKPVWLLDQQPGCFTDGILQQTLASINANVSLEDIADDCRMSRTELTEHLRTVIGPGHPVKNLPEAMTLYHLSPRQQL